MTFFSSNKGQAGGGSLKKSPATNSHRSNSGAEAKAVLRREPANREAKSLVEDIEADMAVAARLKQAQEAMRRGDREEALAQVRAGLAVKNNDGRLLSLFKELTQ